MTVDFTVMAGGAAGQGIQFLGQILAKTMAGSGYHVFADQDYESKVRGGHNFFRVRASDGEVSALSEQLDILIALNRETIELHSKEIKDNGLILLDQEQTGVSPEGDNYFNIPLTKIAEEAADSRLMTNTVAAGAVFGLTECDPDLLVKVLEKELARAGENVVAANVAVARAGYLFAEQNRRKSASQTLKRLPKTTPRMLLNGNEALSLGAMAGGCKFMTGYPMTPASSIMEFLARKGRQYNIVTIHVEDEISAINMAVGAGFTGVRSMTATSGGGFALMVEGLALAGMTETPVVIVLGQRPGPATGLPTRTEQGELWFALHAGHGEFPRAILAPATAEGAFWTTIKAFNLAEKYQTPVIVLTDHHLATSYKTVAKFNLAEVEIDRGALLSAEESGRVAGYRRHLVTDSGISPRALPGQSKSLVVTDSDEHDEAGHMIEDAGTRNQQHNKRLRKLNDMKAEIESPLFNDHPEAELTLIGWGSTYGAISEAVQVLRESGVKANHLHFTELWPFPTEMVVPILNKSTKSIVIENNATGQLAQLIRRETGYKASGHILKYDGRPFSPQYILNVLKKEVA
ncbi:MAG: 2-oxoacid:acceptor oxidoreductase subunit alpha [Chloroflexi bacterium]|nr:2-oxoacid:acceptor oxidoreductase subunit alpha [Chloroflexota bacterium]